MSGLAVGASAVLGLLCSASALAQDRYLDLYFHAQGATSQSILGSQVAGIGDVNHDGFDDIAIAAAGEGVTYIYYGNDNRDSIPDLRLPCANFPLVGLGDINHDGYPDVACGTGGEILFFYGNATTLDTIPGDTLRPPGGPSSGFGVGFAAADFNGDGEIDFAVADQLPNMPDVFRRLYFYSGILGIGAPPVWAITGEYPRDQFLRCEAINLDGDPTPELIVSSLGVPQDEYPPRLMVFDTPDIDSIADLVLYAPDTAVFGGQWWFGRNLVNVSDFNGDGYDDLYAPSNHDFVFWGGPGVWDSIPDLELVTTTTSAASAGDIDLDGHPDIVVGNGQYGLDDGRAEIFRGGASPDGVVDYWMGKADLPPHSLEFIGSGVAPAGDFNGDGAPDIIVVADNLGGPRFMDVFVLGKNQISSGVFDPDGPTIAQTETLSVLVYPSPSNAGVILRIGTSVAVTARVEVFDILGRRVTSLNSEFDLTADGKEYSWNGKTHTGARASSGVYFAVVHAGGISKTVKFVILQ